MSSPPNPMLFDPEYDAVADGGEGGFYLSTDITLRDVFAGMAAGHIVTSAAYMSALVEEHGRGKEHAATVAAEQAYILADALLSLRAREKQG